MIDQSSQLRLYFRERSGQQTFRAGHLKFVIFYSLVKSCFQVSLTIKMSYLWAMPIKITYFQSNRQTHLIEDAKI